MALMRSSALVLIVVGQLCTAYPILPWQAGLLYVGFAAFCWEADSASVVSNITSCVVLAVRMVVFHRDVSLWIKRCC